MVALCMTEKLGACIEFVYKGIIKVTERIKNLLKLQLESNDFGFRININLEVEDASGINSFDARIETKAVAIS